MLSTVALAASRVAWMGGMLAFAATKSCLARPSAGSWPMYWSQMPMATSQAALAWSSSAPAASSLALA